eukprot:jgi/Mesvir1/20579/Mv14820-RA.1
MSILNFTKSVAIAESKSKRVTLKQKHKIIKKVKEHHRKKAKEARKAGHKKKKELKDPGVPAQWPFREQELAAIEAKRAQAQAELEAKKQAKKEARAEKRKAASMEVDAGGDGDALQGLASSAANRETEFERKRKTREEDKSSVHDYSRRAFYRDLTKVLEAADVIVEVLDARDPQGCRCFEVERMAAAANKRVVLLLNKIDLVPRDVVEKWLAYLREEFPCVAFKCNTVSGQRSHLGQKKGGAVSGAAELLQTSDALGADTLLQLIKNYARNEKMKMAVTVGVVGFPNVGKSSLINSLKRARVANVGATPGVTKSLQEVTLDKHVRLLDCPGVVFAAEGDDPASVALRNCVNVDKMEDPVAPVHEIVRRVSREKLMSLYAIQRFTDANDFITLVAIGRGKLKKGALPNTREAAKLILHDWNAGRIPYYTLPPKRQSVVEGSAAIVAAWGKDFDVDEVYKNEQKAVIANLGALEPEDFTEMPASAPLSMATDDAGEDKAIDGEGDEEEDAMDETEGHVKVSAFEHAARGRSFLDKKVSLYKEEGQFNPHAARAAKKKAKKAKLTDDYDFEEDFGDDGDGAADASTRETKKGAKNEESEEEEEEEENDSGSEGEDDESDEDEEEEGEEEADMSD